MKTTFSILMISFIMFHMVFAQKAKVVTTEGEATVTLTEDKSKKQVKDEAKNLAIVNAIENAFGTVIVQGNATYISNVTNGEKVETNTRFNVIGNSMVKGELVEIIKEEYDERKNEEMINIKCRVKIKAKEIVDVPISFEAYTLAGDKKNNKAENFNNGDDLYFYFRSSSSGYLNIFLDDTKTTFRILPYQAMPSQFENGVPIEADKEYVFFSKSPEHSYFQNDAAYIDELTLTSETEKDLNRLFIIFSKEPINKPILKQNNVKLEGDYTYPKELSSEDFQRWKNKNQSLREDMQIKIIDISIEKK